MQRRIFVLLLGVGLLAEAIGCVTGAEPQQPERNQPQFKIVDAAENDEIVAALTDGWTLVNCSIGVGPRGRFKGDSVTREHCYFVCPGACDHGATDELLRAKRAEAPTNLNAIRTAERAYHMEWGTYTVAPPTPEQLPGEQPVAFKGAGQKSFQNLGWVPDEKVYCRYGVTVAADDFVATAECDIDGDGIPCFYTATAGQEASMITAEDIY